MYPSETTGDRRRSENIAGRPEEATLGSGRRAIEIVMAASASTTTPEEDGHWHHVEAVKSQSPSCVEAVETQSPSCELYRRLHNPICRNPEEVP